MSFREKAAWISLFTTLILWGGYFGHFFTAFEAGGPSLASLFANFGSTVVMVVVVQVVLAIVLALLAPKDANTPPDERERLIGLRAAALAYHLMAGALVVVVLGAPALAVYGAHQFGAQATLASTAVLMANGILLCLVLGEVIRETSQIVQFRKDAA